MNLFAQSLGLITEGDHVSLSAGLELIGDNLVDHANGARHTVKTSAQSAITLLQGSDMIAGVWVNNMRDQKMSADQITDTITFLDRIGGLRIRRSLASAIRLAYNRMAFRLRGIKIRTIARRRAANLAGIIQSVARASMPIAGLMAISGVAIYGANFSLRNYSIYGSIFILSLFATTVLHEYVHVFFARHATDQAVILQRGSRIGILHPPLRTVLEVYSAIFGPLVGAISASGFSAMVFLMSHDIFFSSAALLVGLFHLFSLLPAYGDGSTLVKMYRRNHATSS